MSEQDYLAKTKEDLINIVRLSKVMPIGKAQRMRKKELAEYLAQMDREHRSASNGPSDLSGDPTPDTKQRPERKRRSVMVPSEDTEAETDPETTRPEPAETPERSEHKLEVNVRDHRKRPSKPKTKNRSAESDAEAADTKTDERDSDEERHESRTRPAGGRGRTERKGRGAQRGKPDTDTDADGQDPKDDASTEASKASESSNRQESRKNRKQRKDDRPEPHRGQEEVTGVLEVMPDNYGFLRLENYIQNPQDAYVPAQLIRRFNLRNGDLITGFVREQRDQDRYRAMTFIKEVNGLTPDKLHGRPHFDRLTPIYPLERFSLETVKNEFSTRVIDLFAPIGKGQRGMIVSPPKAGKTILLQKIANAVAGNNPNAKLIVLLIDERPEEVTDMQRMIKGEVVYSTFDKTPDNHVRITELVLDRAKRMVELGEDVVILLDSMTRMARAYNSTINPTGRTLSGGLDPGALYGPKKFFGAARNIENGGSLTIVATSLVETGSRMDEVIFEEFKGTGNMEVVLDRKLSERRIFPAIDVNRSGTRREELLLTRKELESVWGVRKAFGHLDSVNVTEMVINLMQKTRDNEHFVASVAQTMGEKASIAEMSKHKA